MERSNGPFRFAYPSHSNIVIQCLLDVVAPCRRFCGEGRNYPMGLIHHDTHRRLNILSVEVPPGHTTNPYCNHVRIIDLRGGAPCLPHMRGCDKTESSLGAEKRDGPTERQGQTHRSRLDDSAATRIVSWPILSTREASAVPSEYLRPWRRSAMRLSV